MNDKFKRQKYTVPLLILCVSFLFVALVFENIYLSPVGKNDIALQVEENIQEKQQELSDFLQNQKGELNVDSFFVKNYSALLAMADKDIYIFGYKNDSIIFWNTNRIVVNTHEINQLSGGVAELPNCYALWDSLSLGEDHLYVFYPIQFVYGIENRFIDSYFQADLQIPSNSVIYLTNLGRSFNIESASGEALFYLDISDSETRDGLNKTLGLLAYLFFLLSVWGVFYFVIAAIPKSLVRNISIVGSVGLIFVIVAFIGSLDYPKLLAYSELFSASVFAMPGIFKNLGLILIFGLLWAISALLFNGHFEFGKISILKNILFSVIMGSVFVEIINLYLNVIVNSVINFQLQLLKEVDFYSLLAYFIFLLLFGGWFFIFDRFARYLSDLEHGVKGIILSMVAMAIAIVLCSFLRDINLVLPSLMATAIGGASFFIRYRRKGGYNFLNRFVILLLFSILGWIMFWQTQDDSDKAKEETLLVNLASSALKERDPISEINLIGKTTQIASDFRIKEMVSNEVPNVDQLLEYLRRFYLGDIWRQYDVQVVLCWPGSNLYTGEDESENNCYNYFEGMLQELGEQIDNSKLYYLNNMNGRVNYFIRLVFNEGTEQEVTLFVDMETRAQAQGIGYPELLSDNSLDLSNMFNAYSFARYMDGQLVNNSGDYQYNVTDNWLQDDTLLQTFNGFVHRLYYDSNNELFILSKPVRTTFDTLLFLVYLFLYLIAITYFSVFLYSLFGRSLNRNRSMAIRIRRSVISILLFSFVFIGATSIYFNVKQYRAKQLEVLKEKNKSVLVSLDSFMGNIDTLSEISVREMTALLQELSNTLYIDINLFDEQGKLYATSRPAIFQRELMNRLIAPHAYYGLKFKNKPFVLEDESLVGLNYLSAYQPLSNWNNDLLGYINLPYFVSSDELSNELSDFIVVLLNIYLIFVIISVALTVLLTREITKPLLMIRERISGFRLRGSNEKIEYSGDDEVAQLVMDYNRLVDELAHSAEQLASNERSQAWRQMARQIAHEIKNPLTPMKLNIQHMQRAKKEGDDRFDNYFEKTTKTLVEQIDNLSRIASEFSSFSKMPISKPMKVDLYERAALAVNLFSETPNVTIKMNRMSQNMWVYVDRELLNQVFNNLIKNAIQSIPSGRVGAVDIELYENRGFAQVKITDNGKGIDECAKEQLFEPNFTTKSSGMGLGLAITKNIIQNSGGEIWFDSIANKGTIFYFTLPKYKE